MHSHINLGEVHIGRDQLDIYRVSLLQVGLELQLRFIPGLVQRRHLIHNFELPAEEEL